MRITSNPESQRKGVLEDTYCKQLVAETLELIPQLFQDSNKIRARYGCKETKESSTWQKPCGLVDVAPVGDLAASFSDFYVPEFSNKSSKPPLIKVDGLQNITKSTFPTSRRSGMLRFGIQQIKNAEMLDIVSDTCEADYPDISDAATVKVDVMTVGTFD
ncbi:hypothetical protein BCR34DRAFT_605627 [Clohesyomyces aquaticus]|uniref:Uncharacterized protein n=1 Tax=Clohesyomyces aquaticus TaxID=1231657 RepID=A0A1Y1YWF1_9PLEO|nr:hypothetical protein BCR34DRAFT_605627 [Clohesyomyces aquaticus]